MYTSDPVWPSLVALPERLGGRATQAVPIWTMLVNMSGLGTCRFMFLTLTYFNFYGIACVAVTPNLLVAAVLSGAFYGKPRPDQGPASHVALAAYCADTSMKHIPFVWLGLFQLCC